MSAEENKELARRWFEEVSETHQPNGSVGSQLEQDLGGVELEDGR
jgi:hypothetical protein